MGGLSNLGGRPHFQTRLPALAMILEEKHPVLSTFIRSTISPDSNPIELLSHSE